MFFKLKNVLATAYNVDQIPLQEYPEIVVAGRSNVGKSSLINSLFAGKKPARVGKHPGKTRSINFYLTDENFVIVDLPGYGFALGPKSDLLRWKRLVEHYLGTRKVIALFLLLIDIRRGPEEEEQLLVKTVKNLKIPLAIILTKCDKVNRSTKIQAAKKISSVFPGVQVIPFSSRTGEGREEILKIIKEALKGNAWR